MGIRESVQGQRCGLDEFPCRKKTAPLKSLGALDFLLRKP
jgi:hypothetical protein